MKNLENQESWNPGLGRGLWEVLGRVQPLGFVVMLCTAYLLSHHTSLTLRRGNSWGFSVSYSSLALSSKFLKDQAQSLPLLTFYFLMVWFRLPPLFMLKLLMLSLRWANSGCFSLEGAKDPHHFDFYVGLGTPSLYWVQCSMKIILLFPQVTCGLNKVGMLWPSSWAVICAPHPHHHPAF